MTWDIPQWAPSEPATAYIWSGGVKYPRCPAESWNRRCQFHEGHDGRHANGHYYWPMPNDRNAPEPVNAASAMGSPRYPAPHYDEDDTCQCPDHVAMRSARVSGAYLALNAFLAQGRRSDLASCGHPRNEDGECDCSSWPERAALERAAPERACLHCGSAVMAERGFYELTLQPFGAAGGCLWTLCTLVCLQAFVAGGGL